MGNFVDGVGFPVEGRFAGETVGLPVELHDFTVKSTILIENHYIGPMGNQLQRWFAGGTAGSPVGLQLWGRP